MTTYGRSALQVAHDALLDLETAKTALKQLESLLCSVRAGKVNQEHANNLLDVAWNVAADAASAASCNYESISDALDDLAPQNAQSENVARDSEVQP